MPLLAAPPVDLSPLLNGSPASRAVFENVGWDEFVAADVFQDQGMKFAYDPATRRLEVERPQGFLHGAVSRLLASLVSAFAREREIRIWGAGSVTLRRRGRGSAEGDESLYIGDPPRVADPRADLLDLEGGDSVPDLVIEVDLIPPGVDKLPILARLGVPEVWVWNEEEGLTARRLNDPGAYETAAGSVELPGFPLAFAAGLIRDRPAADDAALQDALVDHLRSEQ